jgi:hypothetical protein
MVSNDPLFSLSQYNAQDVGKLNSHFNQVMRDFGPHQSVQLFKFLSPFPPSIKVIWLLPFSVSNLPGTALLICPKTDRLVKLIDELQKRPRLLKKSSYDAVV